jgi:hypothetical protein
MPRHGTRSFCCGAGGAQFWKEEEEGEARVADVRFAEAAPPGRASSSPAAPSAAPCSAPPTAAQAEGAPPIRDVAVLLAEGIERVRSEGGAPAGAPGGPPPAPPVRPGACEPSHRSPASAGG